MFIIDHQQKTNLRQIIVCMIVESIASDRPAKQWTIILK